MAATTTHSSISALYDRIIYNYPDFRFALHNDFYWSAEAKTVFHQAPRDLPDIYSLLHEIAHALLSHHSYSFDIELMGQEVAAWELARSELGPTFGVVIPEPYIDEQMDSYRDWLHARSMCLDCDHTGVQLSGGDYSCINCRCQWNVNDARRRRLQKKRRT